MLPNESKCNYWTVFDAIQMQKNKCFSFISMHFSNRKYTLLAQENRRITDIKVFDNTTQVSSTVCYDKPCPGLWLATPTGCVCVCGNDFDLNASGKKCLRQTTKKAKNCKSGEKKKSMIG